MKKRVSLLILMCTFLLSGLNVHATEKITFENFGEYLTSFADDIKSIKSEETISSLIGSVEDLIKKLKPEDVKKLINFIDKQLQDGKWASEEDIEEVISQGEKEFNVTLTEEEKKQILSVVSKIKELGIEPEYLLEKSEEIYEKYGKELKDETVDLMTETGKEILKETKDKIKEEVSKSFTDYFSNMVQSVKSFFKGIFNK